MMSALITRDGANFQASLRIALIPFVINVLWEVNLSLYKDPILYQTFKLYIYLYLNELEFSNLFSVLEYFTIFILILVLAKICPMTAPSGLLSLFDMSSSFFNAFFLVYKRSRVAFYCPGSGISDFSKEPWFLLEENTI